MKRKLFVPKEKPPALMGYRNREGDLWNWSYDARVGFDEEEDYEYKPFVKEQRESYEISKKEFEETLDKASKTAKRAMVGFVVLFIIFMIVTTI